METSFFFVCVFVQIQSAISKKTKQEKKTTFNKFNKNRYSERQEVLIPSI